MRISRKRRPELPQTRRFFANDYIKVPELRVIDENGQNLGVTPTIKALATARERGLDLVVIDPKSNPPVAKFVNFGQFKYQKEKEERKKKAQSHVTEVKGIRLTAHIAEHDSGVRLKQAKGFLERGDKVQIEVISRGRDRAHPEIIIGIMKNFLQRLKTEIPIRIEQDIQRQGTKFTALAARE